MCGIAGILEFERPVEPNLVRAMNDTIVHRGPNDEGYYFDGQVGLGVRRLSIIDIEGGHQPIHNEDESVWLVFNGEIYNYKELRPDLERKNHLFCTATDTETIVHLYEDEAEGCLRHLNGMFAFALWDRSRRRLLLARDRLGVKPLYYYADDHRLCFASELKALLQCPFVPRELDRGALADYLALMYVPAPSTPLRGVRKLPPGHYLVCQDGRITIEQWWSLADHCQPTSVSQREAEETIRELLKDSVRLRLRSDVPVGSFLSGGIDSTAVACFASQQLDRPLETFSVGFPADGISELDYAGIAARAFRTNHHELMASLDDVSQNLPKLVWHLDEPNADSAILPTYLVSQLAGSTMRVILSGLGGDELFGGYHRYFTGRPWRHLYRSVPDPIRGAMLPLARIAPPLHARLVRMEEPPEAAYLRSIRMFSDEEIDTLLGGDDGASSTTAHLGEAFRAYPGRDRANRLMFVDHHTYLPDDILALTDRMSMAASLEARTPFLDYRLVQFAASLPGSWKIRGDEWKIILKKAMAPLVPAEIVTRGKWGFGGPVKAWMNKGLGDALRSFSHDGALVEHGIFDRTSFERIVQSAYVNGVWTQAQKLWALLILELWCHAFLQPASPAVPAYALSDLCRRCGPLGPPDSAGLKPRTYTGVGAERARPEHEATGVGADLARPEHEATGVGAELARPVPDERPLVSAILPVYNVKDSIKNAIDSVLAQTYSPIEILLADNGSWDGTLEILRAYGARIRLFHQPKRGAYPTRNRALREAHGKYVAFLDGDDVWLPEKTEKQVRLLEERPNVGMVYTGRFVVNYRVSPPHRRQDPPPGGPGPPSGRIFNRLVSGNFISNSSVMARRSCIEGYGFFSEKEPIGADYHMWLRISADHVVECLREPLIEYAVHQTNISRDRIANLRSMIRHFDDLIANVQQPECRQALKRARLVLDYDMALRSWRAGWDSFVSGVRAKSVENPGIGFFRRLALFGRLAVSRLRSGQ